MEGREFTIIGGDLRNLKLADFLVRDRNTVNVYGFKNCQSELFIRESHDLRKAIGESDVIIGPLPCSNDNETLNAPLHNEKIYVDEIFKTMSKNQIFIAGRISEKIMHLAQVYNICTADILEREEMAVLNAIPTAEGTIQIAMEEMPITLHNCNALILGYGRIGRILSKMLQGIGANVFVEARKYSDLALIRSYGYKPVNLGDIEKYLARMDLIINTIPHIVLELPLLKKISHECLIIDLASKPGGVDFEAAKTIGLKTIWALSLPGKVAPITAAEFIKDTVYNIMDELGV